MKAGFWKKKWEQGDIAFHQSEVNALLVRHFGKLGLAQGSRVFLPLCGKTRDFAWLLAGGYRVAGAELSEIAVNELFRELGLEPEISRAGKLAHYRARGIDLWAGDIFDVSAQCLGHVDAIYDRAALVALPSSMREAYASHLVDISDAAPQLLLTYDYNPLLMEGPPFPVGADELRHHYGAVYALEPVETRDVAGGLRGIAATETAWVLKRTGS